MTLNISQQTKYDENFNIIEYIEKDSIGNIKFIEQYDSNGNIIYKEDSEGNWTKITYHDIADPYTGICNLKSIINSDGSEDQMDFSSYLIYRISSRSEGSIKVMYQ